MDGAGRPDTADVVVAAVSVPRFVVVLPLAFPVVVGKRARQPKPPAVAALRRRRTPRRRVGSYPARAVAPIGVVVGVVVRARALQVEVALVNHLEVKVARHKARRVVVSVGLRPFRHVFVVRAGRPVGAVVVAVKVVGFGGGTRARVADAAGFGPPPLPCVWDYPARMVVPVQLFV